MRAVDQLESSLNPSKDPSMKSESPIIPRNPGERLPVAVSASGCYIRDAQGRSYLDASGGAAVSCIGHGHPAVIAAMRTQLDRLEYAHTAFFTTEASETLARLLVERSPSELSGVYFVSGGSEAIETAIKLARSYFHATGRPGKHRFIARRQSYHGNTLGALSLGGNLARRELYEPLLTPVSHVSPCFAFRGKESGESDDQYGTRLANELEQTILELGPETVAAFVAETVVGATAGAVTAVPGYFKKIREVCTRHDVLLVLDEVMCGMGRTGRWHAFEAEQIVPDLIALAKGLGGGYQPIGAVMASRTISEALDRSGGFRHGFTYIGHPVAAAAALAVQQTVLNEGLVERCAQAGHHLKGLLEEHFKNHPHVGDIRGRGLFLGLELVASRSDNQPFNPKLRMHAQLRQCALSLGLICYPSGGTIDGVQGDHILIAPSFLVNDNEMTEIVNLLGRAIDQVCAAAVA
jgi:adenosylmethionine-8-amino-7-oxononanoate aminotransferase